MITQKQIDARDEYIKWIENNNILYFTDEADDLKYAIKQADKEAEELWKQLKKYGII